MAVVRKEKISCSYGHSGFFGPATAIFVIIPKAEQRQKYDVVLGYGWVILIMYTSQ